MKRRLDALVDTFFRTLNGRDEAAHAVLYDPAVVYFGSESGLQDQGLPIVRGVFRAAWNSYGVRGCIPRRCFGKWPEIAVCVEMLGGEGADPVPVSEGVFYMVLGEDWRIRKLSILWDFSPFAKRMLARDRGADA